MIKYKKLQRHMKKLPYRGNRSGLDFKFIYDSSMSFRAEVEDVIKTGLKKLHLNKLFFASLTTLINFSTAIKFEILEAINKHHPRSIQELASLIKKDLSFIQKEVMLLESIDLIEITDFVLNGELTKMPKTKYTQIKIIINI